MRSASSDWDALWHALGVEDVSLPQMHTAPASVGRCGDHLPSLLGKGMGVVCALPADHIGWHRSDEGSEWGLTGTAATELIAEPAGLTAEQEIRTEALAAAARIGAASGYDSSGEVLDIAERFESYVRDGAPTTVED